MLCFLVLAQLLAYSISVYRAYNDAKQTTLLLTNLFDLGILQSNRLLIEKISALSEVYGFKKVLLCEHGQVVFSSTPYTSSECSIASSFFESVISLPLVSSETRTANFVYPLFYDYLTSLLFAIGPAIVIIFAIARIKKVLTRIQSDLIDPLTESILHVDNDDGSLSDRSVEFSVAELNALFSAYRAKIQDIKILVATRAELDKQASIGRITSHLSHDLRAPLGIFESLVIMPDANMPSMRGSIKEALNRLYSMIDALKHSEIENLVKRQNCTLSFTLGYQSLLYQAQQRDVVLFAPEVEIVNVSIDALKIERAWLNLAMNAIEAAKKIVRIEFSQNADVLTIRIVDDGDGIPVQIAESLYQRGATYGKPSGTGLGLAYVKQVLQGHGGDVIYRREDNLTIFE